MSHRPSELEQARAQFKDWAAFERQYQKTAPPCFVNLHTLQPMTDSHDAFHSGFHVSVGFHRQLGAELLIFPVDTAILSPLVLCRDLASVQAQIQADLQLLDQPVPHETCYRFPSGFVYRFLAIDQLLEGEALKTFRYHYFFPTLAIFGHDQFKMLSVTLCASEVSPLETPKQIHRHPC